MSEPLYPAATKALADQRKTLAPKYKDTCQDQAAYCGGSRPRDPMPLTRLRRPGGGAIKNIPPAGQVTEDRLWQAQMVLTRLRS